MKAKFLIIVLAAVMMAALVFVPISEHFAAAQSGGDGSPLPPVYTNQTLPTEEPLPPAFGGKTVAEAKLWPNRDASLGFANGGIVAFVYVKEGDTVHKGDVIAEVKGAENYRGQYAEADLSLAAARDELKELNDSYPIDKAETLKKLVEARKALDDAKKTFADYDTPAYRKRLDDANKAYTDKWEDVEDALDLVEKVSELEAGSERKRTVEDDYKKTLQDYEKLQRDYNLLLNDKEAADAAVKAADAEVSRLERELEELADGPKATKLEVVNQKIAAAEAQKLAAEKNIELLQIIAPFDGTVVSLDLNEGELIQAGIPVVRLADVSAQILKTVDLSETNMSAVKIGSRVRVVFDAYPNTELFGTVTKITNWSEKYLGDVVFPVEITLDPNNLPLLWGMTASVYF
ncbi:MAG: HlyD family efflux transporter periplasmic adaptor subunit [Anaerolineaceae bacterium]|nr:HlyD family efflux transporter periplasmic adaptor subunit [Anaerolineaceae bacterium]